MTQAFIPTAINARFQNRTWLIDGITVFSGIILLSLLAQISIPLPFTPVPITGQTFGVALAALLYGRNRGLLIVAGYLFAGGVLHLPVFARGASGITFGATSGYLIGMFFATWLMGTLADRGFNKNFVRTYLSALLGSVVVFTCGLIVLSQFVPGQLLLISGLWPFLPGDFIKTIVAAGIVHALNRSTKK